MKNLKNKLLKLSIFLLAAFALFVWPLACSAPDETKPAPSGQAAPSGQTSSGDQTAPSDQAATAAMNASVLVDYDLTELNTVMLYGSVSSMAQSPEDYLGKTIRIRGLYSDFYFEETESYYHYLVIQDASLCCMQGIEFIVSGDYTFPDDYPENFTEIELEGVFAKYEELDITYYYLAVDEIVVL